MIELKTFKIHDIELSAKKRGLGLGLQAQRFVDSEVLRLSDPLVPMDDGKLKDSGTINTRIGTGLVRYVTPYARAMYNNPQYNFQGAPQRGAKWFERMKASNKQAILNGAAKITGSKGGR